MDATAVVKCNGSRFAIAAAATIAFACLIPQCGANGENSTAGWVTCQQVCDYRLPSVDIEVRVAHTKFVGEDR